MSLTEETTLGKGFQHRLGVRERSWPGNCGLWLDWGHGRRVCSGGWCGLRIRPGSDCPGEARFLAILEPVMSAPYGAQAEHKPPFFGGLS